jgi:hypothetical protein
MSRSSIAGAMVLGGFAMPGAPLLRPLELRFECLAIEHGEVPRRHDRCRPSLTATVPVSHVVSGSPVAAAGGNGIGDGLWRTRLAQQGLNAVRTVEGADVGIRLVAIEGAPAEAGTLLGWSCIGPWNPSQRGIRGAHALHATQILWRFATVGVSRIREYPCRVSRRAACIRSPLRATRSSREPPRSSGS